MKTAMRQVIEKSDILEAFQLGLELGRNAATPNTSVFFGLSVVAVYSAIALSPIWIPWAARWARQEPPAQEPAEQEPAAQEPAQEPAAQEPAAQPGPRRR
jgi:hypothetical protein